MKDLYHYDKKTDSYKKTDRPKKKYFRNFTLFLVSSFGMAAAMLYCFFHYFGSPKEKQLQHELDNMVLQYEVLEDRMNEITDVLGDIQDRDDNIYRVIFEAEPIDKTVREAGFGGANRYQKYNGFKNSGQIRSLHQDMDKITKQLYVQSKSYDDIIEMAQNKAEMLASIPGIQPVANKNLKRMASGYGYRIHPVYKTRKMHHGMDFSAPKGTPVYATGNGVVEKVKRSRRGYGNNVRIDHGYGYKTFYAHLDKYVVKRKQKVKRGDLIGYVGNTGTSTAPHLHYEVRKNGKRVNPVNYYYNDLTPEEYDLMLEMASKENQSFD